MVLLVVIICIITWVTLGKLFNFSKPLLIDKTKIITEPTLQGDCVLHGKMNIKHLPRVTQHSKIRATFHFLHCDQWFNKSKKKPLWIADDGESNNITWKGSWTGISEDGTQLILEGRSREGDYSNRDNSEVITGRHRACGKQD